MKMIKEIQHFCTETYEICHRDENSFNLRKDVWDFLN